MALPRVTNQRERDKFVEDASGNVAIRFIASPGTSVLGKVYLTDGTEDAAINPNNRLEVDLEESSLDLMLGTDFSSVFGTTSLVSATPAIKVEEQGTVAVTGTFWQTTQPVSIAGTVTVDGSGVTQPVSGTFWQSTQPVSVASLPLPSGAATSAKQLADGHNVTVDNAAGAGVYVRPGTSATFDVSDRAARLVGVVYGSQAAQLQQKVTTNDLIVTLDGESVAVTGTFWQSTQPISGTVTVGTFPDNEPFDVAQIGGTTVVTAGVNGMLAVGGNIAHGTGDTSNPLKIGGRAQEPTTAPDEVADNARVDALHDRVGRVATYQGYPRWYAAINTASSGDNTIKAAAGAGKKIVVTSVVIVSDGTVDIRWESGASGTALSGQLPLQTREGYSAYDREGLFETAANTLLNLELSGAINVHGHIAGVIIDD